MTDEILREKYLEYANDYLFLNLSVSEFQLDENNERKDNYISQGDIEYLKGLELKVIYDEK